MSLSPTLAEAYAQICAIPAPMRVRLTAYAARLQEINPELSEAYDELIERIRLGEAGAGAPGEGDELPAFLLPDQNGALVGSQTVLGKGPLVVSCNRGHWCPFCRIELRALEQAHATFAKLGVRVVSIMPDRQQFVARLVKEIAPSFPILTDMDNAYALSLGLVIWLGERITETFKRHRVALDEFHGNEAWFLPIPATFVVGRNGRVRARFVDPDFRNRMEIDEIMDALEQETRRFRS